MNKDMDSTEATALLDRGDAIATQVRRHDTIRRNMYVLWAAVLVGSMAPYDLFSMPTSLIMCLLVIAVGLALTAVAIRRSSVINRAAMRSYTIVMGGFAVWWPLVILLIGPLFADDVAIGSTLTGALGTLPFLAGLVWERQR